MVPSTPLRYCRHQGTDVLLCLFLCCIIIGLCSSRIVMPQTVNAVRGKNVTIECMLELENTSFTVMYSRWDRIYPTDELLAQYKNKKPRTFGSWKKRVHYRSPSLYDATIVIENVKLSDSGNYSCAFTTRQRYFDAFTTVNVLVEPKVYVSAGSSALIDGGNETVVATCIAERALPPANVSWESNLNGQSDVQLFHEDNDTTSTRVRYLWQPTRHVQGHTLTCVVSHPALPSDSRIPYPLDVKFPPNISVVGYDGDWYVGREHVQMTCKANANPPAHLYTWIRLGSEMPEGVEIMNNTLQFLRPLQRNDSGDYRCEVTNDINRRSKDVHIHIQDPPTTPPTITTTVPTGAASSTLEYDTLDPISPTPEAPLNTLVNDTLDLISPTPEAPPNTLVNDTLDLFSPTPEAPPTTLVNETLDLFSPTPEAPPNSDQGSVVGWVVGGFLFLLFLLVGLFGVFYQQTRFRGTNTVTFRGSNIEMM